MKAITIDQFGGIEQLHLAEVKKPTVKKSEVLIHIAYSGLNPVDWKICEGLLKTRMTHTFPLIPGWDAAGTIVELSDDVTDFKLGDAVFAYCRKEQIAEGTYAEYIAVPAHFCAKKPSNLSFSEAAAIPLAALTAWQCLFDAGKLKHGDLVFIESGSGGVGSFAIQFAALHGAQVITTTSGANFDYVKSLGADIAIDYHAVDFEKRIGQEFPNGIDLVLDMLGGETMQKASRLLKKGGRLISILEPMDANLAQKMGIVTEYVFVKPNGKQLTEIAGLLQSGKLKVPPIEEFPLAEAKEAQELSRQGHTRGKIVLKVK